MTSYIRPLRVAETFVGRRGFVAALGGVPVLGAALHAQVLHAAVQTRDIREFGAVSDPSRDQQAALQAALDWCSHSKGVLRLEKGGIYCHSSGLDLGGGTISGMGGAFRALVPENGRLRITGAGVTLRDLTLASPASKRSQAYSGIGLLVQDAHDFTLTNIAVHGAATAGILMDDAHRGTLRNILVRGTMADGLHITNGSSYIDVANYQAIRTGDDGFAVVSYDRSDQKGRRCNNIRGRFITVIDGNARGVAVVGGADVTVEDVKVVRSACAGLYLNSEVSYGTFGNAHISAARVQLVDCVTRKGINQGVVHIEGRKSCSVQRLGGDALNCSSQDVRFSGIVIEGLGIGARAGVVAAGDLQGISVSGRRASGQRWNRPASQIDTPDPKAKSISVSLS